ncbi:MAG: energy-coupling factor transporter transmembrane protein EcfT [Fibrobacteria bacterium]|nr:energy-coupling factor transporter transmembrane protein EcfT [Fibrobacteria bacterium]
MNNNGYLSLSALDPRVKLLVSGSVLACLFLPFIHLFFLLVALYLLLAAGDARVRVHKALQKLALPLVLLFLIDWLLLDFSYACLITLRIFTLTLAFQLFTGFTRTSSLFRLMRWLYLPRKAAFSLTMGLQYTQHLGREWRHILEAQRLRGLPPRLNFKDPRQWNESLRSVIPMAVPVFVLTVRRAWQLSEAAWLRGIDSPASFEERRLKLSGDDIFIILSWVMVMSVITGTHFI